MRLKAKLPFLIITILIFFSALYYYPPFKKEPPPQELAKQQLSVSAVSLQSMWNQGYFDENIKIKDKIVKFENGTLCKSLKTLDTKNLTHTQISQQLKDLGYICIVRPLSENPLTEHPKSRPIKYLKTDNTITPNPEEPGVAHQEICYDRTQPDCVIRIKRDGFPLNRRSNPHSTKAVLIDSQGDPGSYDNEAFKIGANGQAIPKGPSKKFGLKKCPYKKKKDLCNQWMDALMEEAHPALKETVGTQVLPSYP